VNAHPNYLTRFAISLLSQGLSAIITSAFPILGSAERAARKSCMTLPNFGTKRPLSKAQTQAVQAMLFERKEWRDLAMLMLATDTHLRAVDFLRLRVCDVQDVHGNIRGQIIWRQRKTNRTVCCSLSEPTRQAVAHWISVSAKQGGDCLFTRLISRKDKPDNTPIGRKAFALRVKSWVETIGLDPSQYSTKTLRKSRIRDILEAADYDYQVPQQILGHADIRSTIAYCAIKAETALAISEQVQFFKPLSFPNAAQPANSPHKNLTKPAKR